MVTYIDITEFSRVLTHIEEYYSHMSMYVHTKKKV